MPVQIILYDKHNVRNMDIDSKQKRPDIRQKSIAYCTGAMPCLQSYLRFVIFPDPPLLTLGGELLCGLEKSELLGLTSFL